MPDQTDEECEMVEGDACMTSLSKAITTTRTESDCSKFSACNAHSTDSTETETTTLSCAAAPVTKSDAEATGVPLARQAPENSPKACQEESLPTIIYPSNPFRVGGIVQILKNIRAERKARKDTTFSSVTIDSPSLKFTAFYWVSALTPTEMNVIRTTLKDQVR